MSELVDEDFAERRMVASGEGDLIVDAPSPIGVGIDQHHDVFEGHTRQQVVDGVHVLRSQIALAVEGVVVGAHSRLFPHAAMGHRRPGLGAWGSHSHHIETVLQACERLPGEECIHGTLAVGEELAHLLLGVAFGKDGEVDAVSHVHILKGVVLRSLVAA